MLTLPSGIQTLLESGRFAVRYLVRFELASGAQGAWNDTFSLTHSGLVYAPLGGNFDVSEVPASSELDSDRVRVVVSNLSNQVTTVIANEQWHQRPCTLFVAFLDDAGNVQHVMTRFSGVLDEVEIADAADGQCALTLSIESNSRELNRASGDTRSDASQRRRLSSDGFFKHAAYAAADTDIYWGRKGPQFPAKVRR